MWWSPLPGFGAQHSLDKVSHGEEKQHNQHPGKFPRDHGNVVVSLVHKRLATGDGCVSLWAAFLFVPAIIWSTFMDGTNACRTDKTQSENIQSPPYVEKHRWVEHEGIKLMVMAEEDTDENHLL